ncbi:MAG: amidase [Thermomicrobiales bacterium]|nr:amidase [Thermomicrobiales bacterium]
MTSELNFATAREMARLLREREISAVELLDAHLDQIARVNPAVNAIVTLLPERAREQARAADAVLARGEAVGPLHGLPIAHKDTTETKGIRTTKGSPIFRDYVPERNELIIDRIQAAGAIPIGKTNVPEFGAGSQTFNTVFGTTLNPYDLTKTPGGSSGGAAAALATGMHPIADGSDLGGSLRNPGGYCNVVGFRPSAGRVPKVGSQSAWFDMTTTGPLARTVGDVALLMSVIAGPDLRSPIALEAPGSLFEQPLERDFRGTRVAWSRNLGDLPVDPRTTAVLESQRGVFADLGLELVEAEPDLSGADEVFHILRAWDFELGYGELLDTRRDQLKDTVIWNIEEGRRLSGPDLGRANRLRSAIFQRAHDFFANYEFLLLPVSQVPPFPADIPYPTEIDGTPMTTYIEWMRSCSRITVTGHPAISVPAGFTADGLPVGLQIVGRARDDFGVLQLAHAFELATNFWQQRPPLLDALARGATHATAAATSTRA